jgi:Helicase conserved C-terminal domain
MPSARAWRTPIMAEVAAECLLMSTGSFAQYLSSLDEAALTALLQARPDARMEPVPRGFTQLAQRLCGTDSVGAAMRTLNRDALVVGQAIAVLGASATVPAMARMLDAPEQAVRDGLAELCGRGLAWDDSSGRWHLPEQLESHWLTDIGGGRPVAMIARSVLLENLRTAAEALGIAVDGLRKQELIGRLSEVMSDRRAMAAAVARLPMPVRNRLNELRRGYVDIYFGYYSRSRHDDPTDRLVEAGLVLRVNSQPELPREVAVGAWLAERRLMLTGRPDIPKAGAEQTAVRVPAQAAAQEALRGLTTLLDEAQSKPITALKKGGVGTRERTRLANRLSIPDEVLVLWIDLAYTAGLLGPLNSGYAPTDAYAGWRAAEPCRQWAALADAWFSLEHAPTSREIEDDKELPPPLPLGSAAGQIRRALLSTARSGSSVHGVGREIDWFFPLEVYDAEHRAAKVAAAIREAEVLGVVASDVLTEFGEHLVDVADLAQPERVAELAQRCAPLLPEAPCSVLLQSDLTAVVTGQPGMALSRLLAAAAVSEARGTACVWRFTPTSVRAALDAGWRAEDLLAELKALSNRAVPQPLEYLITDAARRHGQVRVRGMRSCLLADEAMTTEILHTRSLGKLQLSRLAPTVLASPEDIDTVLAGLRAAGLSPVAEDAFGVVIVEGRREHRAPTASSPITTKVRSQLSAVGMARQLVADPTGDAARQAGGSSTLRMLEQLNDHLNSAELELLSDAVDSHNDVLITYRDRNGSRSIRAVRPNQIYGLWLDCWCHLRNAQRDFTIANIESVAPAS